MYGEQLDFDNTNQLALLEDIGLASILLGKPSNHVQGPEPPPSFPSQTMIYIAHHARRHDFASRH